MLTLENPITLDSAAILSPNLCDRFSDEDLTRIGLECWEGYDRDERSRARWMERNEAGMDLALQIQQTKNFPWAGCANVAFPLVTIAAMQFHARAYPAIVGGSQLVKCPVIGLDPDGSKTAWADRVSTHMSWQLLYQDKAWQEQEDKAILNLSIVGTTFKKTYYSSSLRHNVSELVLAKDLVLNYWAKSVEDCPRKTHKIPLFRNDVYERVMRGTYRDCLEEAWYTTLPSTQTTPAQGNKDNRQGSSPPTPDDSTALLFLEQHVDLDLDDDGYAEPYIVTFEERSKYVVRIITNFNSDKDIERVQSGPNKGKIIRITKSEYFTKKAFIPSPDGGIYDIGFGVFLGPLNEAVNSLVNMLLDAGTLQTTAGGFLARGAKIRGGVATFSPFEWKHVDSNGDDLRKSVYPLPVNAPSDVLFQLLALLINYTNRIAGTQDAAVGENPGQNTPAQTMQTMVELGQKVYAAIFQRLWWSTREEFCKLFKLNGIFLPIGVEQVGGATRDDYQGDADRVVPVADPRITSETMRLQLATAVKQSAASTPGYNHDEVERRWLKALHVEAIDQVFPGTQGQPPAKDPKLLVAELKEQGAMQRQQAELAAKQQEFILSLMEERRMNNVEIVKLLAEADEAAANAQSEQAYAQVAAINAQVAAAKNKSDAINMQIDHLLRAAEIRSRHEVALLSAKKSEKAAA